MEKRGKGTRERETRAGNCLYQRETELRRKGELERDRREGEGEEEKRGVRTNRNVLFARVKSAAL